MNSHLLNSHLDRHPAAGAAGRRALAAAYAWNRRRHERRTLAELDDHLLRDIGIDRHQALVEASKPFWEA